VRGGEWDDDWSTAGEPGGVTEPDDDEWTGAGRRSSTRAKLIYTIVVGAATLVSLVLCCVAAGEAGQLLWLELPPP
jgi:hypothetical protein